MSCAMKLAEIEIEKLRQENERLRHKYTETQAQLEESRKEIADTYEERVTSGEI